MPMRHRPGAMIPGLLGPTRRVWLCPLSRSCTASISWTGICSVTETTSGTFASIACIMALAARSARTITKLTSGLTSSTALFDLVLTSLGQRGDSSPHLLYGPKDWEAKMFMIGPAFCNTTYDFGSIFYGFQGVCRCLEKSY